MASHRRHGQTREGRGDGITCSFALVDIRLYAVKDDGRLFKKIHVDDVAINECFFIGVEFVIGKT